MMVAANVDKAKVRQAFSAAAHDYDVMAAMQREVGLALLRRFPVENSFEVILDLGCGTGFLAQQLSQKTANHPLVALDLALPMLRACRGKRPEMAAHYLCADAEMLPLVSRSIGQIYSNLALQWVENLPGAFVDCRRVLIRGGQLVFATFGPRTLQELKAAWASVDEYTHVNSFYSGDEIQAFLTNAGFVGITVEHEVYRYNYPSVRALMRELKGIGAHNVNLGRKRRLTTKTQLQNMIDHYHRSMAGSAIVASYEILFVRARV